MGEKYPKWLLVEGKNDVPAIASFMGHWTAWLGPKDKDKWPVYIEAAGSDGELLAEGYLSNQLKRSGMEALGMVIDANGNCAGRWQRVRQLCSGFFSAMPEKLPLSGLIHTEPGKPRFGLWVMPDNTSSGMIETFLRLLVPNQNDPVWLYAQDAAKTAKERGAPYKDVHVHKAHIHTWLAWQDEPGQPLGDALKSRKVFDPKSAAAKSFADWFIELFELERLAAGHNWRG